MTNLFATRLQEADLSGLDGWSDLNAELEAACLMLAEEDEAGLDWSAREGYGGYTSYASLDDLPDRIPAMAQLAELVLAEAHSFTVAVAWDMTGRRLVMDSFWVNVLDPGGAHSGHIHPLSVISGTYYVAIPDTGAAIRFEDPRLARMMAAPPVQADAPETLKRFVTRTPRPGLALFWESWLRHEVLRNDGDAPRLSISFNLALEAD